VIDGLTTKAPVFQPVDTAIADVRYGDASPVDVNECNGGCHRFVSRIAFSEFEDVAIRELDRAANQLR
jgi:hypothetical protein